MTPTARPTDHTANGAIWAVVVAGGGGTRFGGPKQYAELAGRRVLDWSVRAAAAVANGVVVVVPEGGATDLVEGADTVVTGGATRTGSVRRGLEAVPPGAAVVVVHDAARPAASADLFRRVVDAVLAGADGAVPGVAVTDSLRHPTSGAVDREGIVAVQTPQAFRAGTLRAAHAAGSEATDDATLVEQAGGTIVVVDGEVTNTKLTHPHDAVALEATLRSSGNDT